MPEKDPWENLQELDEIGWSDRVLFGIIDCWGKGKRIINSLFDWIGGAAYGILTVIVKCFEKTVQGFGLLLVLYFGVIFFGGWAWLLFNYFCALTEICPGYPFDE